MGAKRPGHARAATPGGDVGARGDRQPAEGERAAGRRVRAALDGVGVLRRGHRPAAARLGPGPAGARRPARLVAAATAAARTSPLALAPTYERWYWEYLTAGTEGGPWDSRAMNIERHYGEHADVPAMYSGGWYDSYTRATIRNWAGLGGKRSPQHLLMGPWTHGDADTGLTYAGDADLGADAPTDLVGEQIRWFDRWLKGAGETQDPTVRYFLMGGGSGRRLPDGRLDHGGSWRGASTWPPPGSADLHLFLTGDGHLVDAAGESGTLGYDFDPDDPVPTIGGNISFLGYLRQLPDELLDAISVLDRRVLVSPVGGRDQRTYPGLFGARPPYGPLAARADVLTFTTGPLPAPVQVTGPVRVKLWVDSNAPDTDFTAKLVDWYPPNPDYPEGYALNVADGIQRLRFARGFDRERLHEPGSPVPVLIEMYPTANVFAAGHRIRLDVSSSNFPRFDVNPNTGGPLGSARTTAIARNTVYLGREHPSRLELTVSG
ncbi:MAG: CocE/NonD family hydrolase [Streptosporangiales bacterium]|nr:CocE/NonD family hydrolase [Streptosporangiales bacterium]